MLLRKKINFASISQVDSPTPMEITAKCLRVPLTEPASYSPETQRLKRSIAGLTNLRISTKSESSTIVELEPDLAPPPSFLLRPSSSSPITRPHSTSSLDSHRKLTFDDDCDHIDETSTNTTNTTSSSNPLLNGKNQRNGLVRSQSASPRLGDTEVVSPRPEDSLESTFSMTEIQEPLLPHFQTGQCAMKRVSVHTVASLVRGEIKNVDKHVIIDCRYDYEYEAGHLKDALNLSKKQAIERFFKDYRHTEGKHVIIFHCEFSKHRGPNCARFLRQLDRTANKYPALTFPDVYVMDGGYKAFFENYSNLCSPEVYVSMWDTRFADVCRERHKAYKRSWANETSRRLITTTVRHRLSFTD